MKMKKIRQLLAVTLVGGALTFVVPTTAQAAPSKGFPVCERYPYGTPGCEHHTGTAIRSALIGAGYANPIWITNWELGHAAADLCFHGRFPTGMQWHVGDVAHALDQVNGPYCG